MSSILLSGKIASSEALYKNILEEFFAKYYDIAYLPSHGIDHHRRAWHYAKKILNQLNNQGFEISQSLTDQLIISCFLHDSGMSVDQGSGHGAEGRKICSMFLLENNLSADLFSDALDAIENHDNKEYSVIHRPEDILTVLSVADDLDALGFIGIYRYLEIYIARNKPMQELGYLIIENCETRFRHFLRSYGSDSLLVEENTKRYNILTTFFNSYNEQSQFYKFDNQSITGYCGVAEMVCQMLKVPDIISKVGYEYDPVIQWFFGELNSELSDFR